MNNKTFCLLFYRLFFTIGAPHLSYIAHITELSKLGREYISGSRISLLIVTPSDFSLKLSRFRLITQQAPISNLPATNFFPDSDSPVPFGDLEESRPTNKKPVTQVLCPWFPSFSFSRTQAAGRRPSLFLAAMEHTEKIFYFEDGRWFESRLVSSPSPPTRLSGFASGWLEGGYRAFTIPSPTKVVWDLVSTLMQVLTLDCSVACTPKDCLLTFLMKIGV